jgi:D-3-phosphoglycerate dehydrogenase
MRPLVDIYTPLDQSGASHKRLRDAGCKVELGDASWMELSNLRGIRELTTSADSVALMGIAARALPVTAKVMSSAPGLRIISKYTVGVDDVDLDYANERGILVTHCPTESNWAGVAEGTMAMILTMLKKTREKDRAVKEGNWRSPDLIGTGLGRRYDGYPGLTVGIIGLGRIGTRLVQLLAPWRLRIVAHDPYIPDTEFIQKNVENVSLNELLESSDIVSLHCNLTPETHNMIGTKELARMQPNAILINAARGVMVDIKALEQALRNNIIAGAAIDVLPKEPAPEGLSLLELGDKVLMSPHMVSVTQGGGLELAIPWATNSVLKALRGEVPDNVYNKEAITLWLERFGGKDLLAQC